MFLQPIRAGPRTTACGSRTQSSPSSTPSLTTANAPIRTFCPMRALAETTARESTSLIAHTNRVVGGIVARSRLGLAVHEHAAQNGLRRDIAVDGCDCLEFAKFHFPLQHRHLDTQLISRHHWPAETRLI